MHAHLHNDFSFDGLEHLAVILKLIPMVQATATLNAVEAKGLVLAVDVDKAEAHL